MYVFLCSIIQLKINTNSNKLSAQMKLDISFILDLFEIEMDIFADLFEFAGNEDMRINHSIRHVSDLEFESNMRRVCNVDTW